MPNVGPFSKLTNMPFGPCHIHAILVEGCLFICWPVLMFWRYLEEERKKKSLHHHTAMLEYFRSHHWLKWKTLAGPNSKLSYLSPQSHCPLTPGPRDLHGRPATWPCNLAMSRSNFCVHRSSYRFRKQDGGRGGSSGMASPKWSVCCIYGALYLSKHRLAHNIFPGVYSLYQKWPRSNLGTILKLKSIRILLHVHLWKLFTICRNSSQNSKI